MTQIGKTPGNGQDEDAPIKIEFGDYFIRSWNETDAPMIAKHADNRHIWLNLRDRFPHPYTVDDAKRFIANASALKPETLFAIADLTGAIGSIGLSLGQDVHRYTAELGYWLAEPYWNRGIMTGAIGAVTTYAFENLGLTRIFAEPYATNPVSARVLEKAGFQCEGRLRASVFKDGKVLDQFMYAKTKTS